MKPPDLHVKEPGNYEEISISNTQIIKNKNYPTTSAVEPPGSDIIILDDPSLSSTTFHAITHSLFVCSPVQTVSEGEKLESKKA